jgi:transcription antitermination factor NusG
MMPLPRTMVESLDDFYRFCMEKKGLKPHEVDQMDIHHLFRLVKGEQKKEQKKEEPQQKMYIDQIAGW